MKLIGIKSFIVTAFLMLVTIMEAQTFTNPILGGDHPDPTIVRDGKDYYMTYSSFEYLPGLIVLHSTDLVNWEPIGSALHQNLGSVWAPDICKFKGKYYIYFTVSKGNDLFFTYVVTADTPAGPWSEPVDLKQGKWIDPCHVYDEKTKTRWLFFSGGNRIRLSKDGLSTDGAMENVYKGWPIPKDWIIEGTALEGPKMKKIGDYYYFLNAEGGTAGPATTHMAIVARSKSVDGPWENSPTNPLIHTYSVTEQWWSKGHASLIDTPDGKWWAVYHAYNKDRLNQGRQTLLEPIELTADGWLKASTGASVNKPLPLPIIKEGKTKNQNVLDNSSLVNRLASKLSEFRIGKEWRGPLDFDASRFQVNNGVLSFTARGNNPGTSSPLLFVAPDKDYEISALFEIEGEAEAGLIFYYNKTFFAGFGSNKDRKNCWRRGIRRGKGSNTLGNAFWIKLRFEDNVITGFLSRDGRDWQMMQWGMEVSGYNHNTLSDFLSLLPGVYCYGNGSVKVSHFCYLPIGE